MPVLLHLPKQTNNTLRSLACLQAWQQLCADVLRPDQPLELHQRLFSAIYSSWSEEQLGPAPVWVPDTQQVQQTNIARFMARFHVSQSTRVWYAGQINEPRQHLQHPSSKAPLKNDVCKRNDILGIYLCLSGSGSSNSGVWGASTPSCGARSAAGVLITLYHSHSHMKWTPAPVPTPSLLACGTGRHTLGGSAHWQHSSRLAAAPLCVLQQP